MSAPDLAGVRSTLQAFMQAQPSIVNAQQYEAPAQGRPDGYPLSQIWLTALTLGGDAEFSRSEWVAEYTIRVTYNIDAKDRAARAQGIFDTLLGEVIDAFVSDQRLEAYDDALDASTTRIDAARFAEFSSSVLFNADTNAPEAIQWAIVVNVTLIVNTT